MKTTAFLTLLALSISPLSYGEPAGEATVTIAGKTITVPLKSNPSPAPFRIQDLPKFDIAGFMAKGAAGMAPGFYRLGSDWVGELKLSREENGAMRHNGKITVNAVGIYSQDKVILLQLHNGFNPTKPNAFNESWAFLLRPKETLLRIGSEENLESLKVTHADLARPTATEIDDKTPAFHRIVRQASFTDTGKIALSIITFRSDPPKTKTGIRLHSPTPDFWKMSGFSVSEGVATPAPVVADDGAHQRRNASLLLEYIKKQPELARDLMKASVMTDDTFDGRAYLAAKTTFYKNADAAIVAALVAKTHTSRIFISEADIGVPKDEVKPGWNGKDAAIVLTLDLISVLPLKDLGEKTAPDADARRYLKLLADALPDLTEYAAAESVAAEIMRRYGIPLLAINRDGVRLRIEYFPDGASSRGVISAPPGKAREARILLRDTLLAEMAKR